AKRSNMAETLAMKSSHSESAEQSQTPLRELTCQSALSGIYGGVMSLQRSAGNRVVSHFLGANPGISAATGAVLQRKCMACASGGSECGECREKREATLQRSTSPAMAAGWSEGETAPPIVHEVLRSPGQPLEPSTRVLMESRFG